MIPHYSLYWLNHACQNYTCVHNSRDWDFAYGTAWTKSSYEFAVHKMWGLYSLKEQLNIYPSLAPSPSGSERGYIRQSSGNIRICGKYKSPKAFPKGDLMSVYFLGSVLIMSFLLLLYCILPPIKMSFFLSFIPSVIILCSFACLKCILWSFSQCHTGASTGNIAAISSFPKPVRAAQTFVSERFGILKQNRQRYFQSRLREFPVSNLSTARIMTLCTLHPLPTSKGI